MEKEQDKQTLRPTKKTVIIVTIIWLVGSTLTILAVTDLFSESIFQYENLMTIFLLIPPSVSVLYIYRNYYKNLNT